MPKNIFTAIVLFACTFSATAMNVHSNQEDNSYAAIAKRLAPPGIVDVLGQNKIIVQKNNDAALPPRGGNEIFAQYCIVCHGTGAAGSPKFGCASAWAPRKAKGMTVLLQHAENGYNFMPVRGTCMDCSNGELEEAIRYMINNSNKDDVACKKNA